MSNKKSGSDVLSSQQPGEVALPEGRRTNCQVRRKFNLGIAFFLYDCRAVAERFAEELIGFT